MAAANWEQTWGLFRYSNEAIILTGPDATGWTLVFEIGNDPEVDPILSITPSISTVTVTIPLTVDQMTDTLTEPQYLAALWRTDDGSEKPLASGTIVLTKLPHPS